MQKLIKLRLSHLATLAIFLLVLGGCQTIDSSKNWPLDIPKRSIFVDAYKTQLAKGTNEASLETHLMWIKRFYNGSIIYPVGWNDMMDTIVNSLETQKDVTRKRLEELGLKMSIEWAQSNQSRNISSSNIATWGNALRTSVERKQQLPFLDIVEKDVDDLIARKLDMKLITRERYYPEEDYDNF